MNRGRGTDLSLSPFAAQRPVIPAYAGMTNNSCHWANQSYYFRLNFFSRSYMVGRLTPSSSAAWDTLPPT